MSFHRFSTTLLTLATMIWLVGVGCREFGRVNQGRVVDFDRGSGLVTVISDSNYKDPENPRYDVLPPVTIRVPEDPAQMGPAPEAGDLVNLDTRNRKLMIFDPASRSLKTIAYTLVEQRDDVFKNDPQVRGRSFPIIDRDNKRISVYLPGSRQIITFSVPEEYMALPDNTWKLGDEIRYYFKEPDKALRLMNVTRTDIS